MKLFKKKKRVKQGKDLERSVAIRISKINFRKKDAFHKLKKQIGRYLKKKFSLDIEKKTYEDLIKKNCDFSKKKKSKIDQLLIKLNSLEYSEKPINKDSMDELILYFKEILKS